MSLERPYRCTQSCQVPVENGWTEFHAGTVYDAARFPELDADTLASYFEPADEPRPGIHTRATSGRKGE